jgi:hypothetical protein
MLEVGDDQGKNAASVMFSKGKFIEGWSSYHYVYEPATPADSRILELFRVNFYESSNPIDETTAAGGTPQSSSTGQYTQPAIWAKNKKNWKGAAKTQYPNGEFVEIDSCAKLNNNKSVQNGKCGQGAIDSVVKTKKTSDSVISKSIYETIAKKTGRTIDEVRSIIKTKMQNNKTL